MPKAVFSDGYAVFFGLSFVAVLTCQISGRDSLYIFVNSCLSKIHRTEEKQNESVLKSTWKLNKHSDSIEKSTHQSTKSTYNVYSLYIEQAQSTKSTHYIVLHGKLDGLMAKWARPSDRPSIGIPTSASDKNRPASGYAAIQLVVLN